MKNIVKVKDRGILMKKHYFKSLDTLILIFVAEVFCVTAGYLEVINSKKHLLKTNQQWFIGFRSILPASTKVL